MDKVVHFEVPVKKMARARKFYKDLFGWKLMNVPFSGMENEYVLAQTVKTAGKHGQPPKEYGINGALDRNARTTCIVISVANIDTSLKRIAARGGRIVKPRHEIPKIGYYAKVRDTEGNLIALIQTFSGM
jgi:hypothetical protein